MRDGKDDPGSGEKAIGGATLVDASVSRQLGGGLWLSLQAKNLLDEVFFPSADRKASPARGRSVGVGLRWRTGSP